MNTREQILSKNYEAMCLHGFQGLRTDKVINELGITKGAFYHYFSGKKELGYAIVDEIIAPHYIGTFAPLKNSKNGSIEAITSVLEYLKGCSSRETIHIGCPLNNLVQEMSPLDDTFRDKLRGIFEAQKDLLVIALSRGVENGELKEGIMVEDVAFYIISGIEGSYALGKAFQSKKVFDRSIDQLIGYVRLLKKD
ncbi:TetR/AcrR family transcriptional regulator [Fulvivirga sp. 29W222]|uniref:TetR/AcrR family transcriptional regulator n=1 Tax=Fulvivirga marina TaxID=2494733 RepID=A0A937KB45_9BACT|nr:TetR/AcrR family transcriptional regulator [Fulvivirga marina]MBL6445444.1 TetR/AcrR family transcriptional regulator [Fulvivirga marina]